MSTATITIPSLVPPVGVHPNVPAEDYHAWDCASAHRLSTLRRSPAHMRHAIDHPAEPTPAMRLGTAFHANVLEPALFGQRYAVAGQCSATTGRGARCSRTGSRRYGGYDWYCEQHADEGADEIEKLDPADAERITNMALALVDHPAASAILGAADLSRELSVVWDDAEAGVRCKLRADLVSAALGVAADLKTCDDASPDAFARSIVTYGYHVQAAHYLRGLAAVGIVCDSFVFGCVEKDPPHAVACYRIDDESLEAGDRLRARLLAEYARCERARAWPAFDGRVQDIGLPQWALAKERT